MILLHKINKQSLLFNLSTYLYTCSLEYTHALFGVYKMIFLDDESFFFLLLFNI